MSDAAIRSVIRDLPSTPLKQGIDETMRRFAELRDRNQLDVSDLDQ
jgi:hypothetical protein